MAPAAGLPDSSRVLLTKPRLKIAKRALQPCSVVLELGPLLEVLDFLADAAESTWIFLVALLQDRPSLTAGSPKREQISQPHLVQSRTSGSAAGIQSG